MTHPLIANPKRHNNALASLDQQESPRHARALQYARAIRRNA